MALGWRVAAAMRRVDEARGMRNAADDAAITRQPIVDRAALRASARAAGLLTMSAAAAALGGGTAEHAMILVDPSNADSLYVANYYRAARDVPDSNFLYYPGGAFSLTEFYSTNRLATLGAISNQQISDHADYLIVMPGAPFFVAAPGEISDSCFTVNRFSVSSIYTLLYELPEIIGPGTRPSSTPNYYYTTGNVAVSFNAQSLWLNGFVSTSPAAERYLIGALLGYSGTRGNTVDEILDMIDRSVASDGTRPTGTFYFMRTSDAARSAPRDPAFGSAVAAIVGNGGAGMVMNAVLPTGRNDCLGVMTGWPDPAIDTTNFTIRPGAFCDHLTSWAATFDTAGQTKTSRWIAKGASGSFGTVEEPCNYAGKFPAPRVHVFYQRGLTLGEACFRSLAFQPYQGLLVGDPLTRTFATIPTVTISGWPTGAVSGALNVTPTVGTSPPVGAVRLLIDGVLFASQAPGSAFSIDTTRLSDGWHDVRFLADVSGSITTSGRLSLDLLVNNRGRATTLSALPASGDLASLINCSVSTGAAATQVRIRHNGRVVAGQNGTSANFTLVGAYLGAGPVDLIGESVYPDGTIVRSAARRINLATSGTPNPAPPAPAAFDFTRDVNGSEAFAVELPVRFSGDFANLTFEVVSGPNIGSISATRAGPFLLYTPDAGQTCGATSFTYRVWDGATASNVGTVRLNYGVCAGDANCDGVVSVGDIGAFVSAIVDPAAYNASQPGCSLFSADVNGDGFVTPGDIGVFVTLLTGG